MAARKGEWGRATRAGIVAGLMGGLAFQIFNLIVAGATGQSGWAALKGASAPFLGTDVLVPGFVAGPVLLGVLMHYVVASIWGVLFGWVFYGISRNATMLAGLFWGLVAWIGMFNVVLPIAGLATMVAGAPKGLAVVSHLVFGFFVALAFLPNQRPRIPIDLRRPGETPVQRPTRGGRDIEPPSPPV